MKVYLLWEETREDEEDPTHYYLPPALKGVFDNNKTPFGLADAHNKHLQRRAQWVTEVEVES